MRTPFIRLFANQLKNSIAKKKIIFWFICQLMKMPKFTRCFRSYNKLTGLFFRLLATFLKNKPTVRFSLLTSVYLFHIWRQQKAFYVVPVLNFLPKFCI